MIFNDGLWLKKKGYDVHYATEAYEVLRRDEHSVTLLATPSKIYNRGMTLGGPNLEVTFFSYLENVIGVRVVHYAGARRSQGFELARDDSFTPEITVDDNAATLVSGRTSVRISRDGWRVEFFDNAGIPRKLTSSGARSLSYIVNDMPPTGRAVVPRFFDKPDDAPAYVQEKLSLGVGECVYGFGEKFTPFVKNGQTVEMWNSDGGTGSAQSYKCVPFYLSDRGYGVFVNTSGYVSFETASDSVSGVSFTVPGESLEYYVIGGGSPSAAVMNYTKLTGRPPLVPEYSFGLWLSTSFTTDYSEETINSFINGMAERDIPLQVFHFDCFWMREFRWCDFEWDRRQFPDPEAMLKRLRERGLAVCVWINPYIAQLSPLFDEARKADYLVKTRDGGVFQCDLWQPGLAIVDFTNPAARDWYKSKLRKLLDMGVTNLKTDFGERIPTDAVYHDGSDPTDMHNYYTYLYNKTVYELLCEYYGDGKACLFARSATTGSQKFPVHWGGDCTAEYVSMAETLRGGLSLGLCGFGYYSHDISGFEATASPDVYKRWAAFGLLSSHSRLHGSSSYRVPWLFDEESVDVLRFFTKLKGRLMPYLWSQAINTHITGLPMMRAMLLEFPDDLAARRLDTQYMLGDNLLVAPVFDESGDVDFYLPDGIWQDIITGERYVGGRYYHRHCGYLELPLLAREGSIIAYGDFRGDFEYDYLDGCEFVVYNLRDGETASTSIYDADGKRVFTLTARRDGDVVTWESIPTERGFSVRVVFAE